MTRHDDSDMCALLSGCSGLGFDSLTNRRTGVGDPGVWVQMAGEFGKHIEYDLLLLGWLALRDGGGRTRHCRSRHPELKLSIPAWVFFV